METISNRLKKIAMSFTPSQALQPAPGISSLPPQPSFVIPPSPTLQRLEDRAIQTEARNCLTLLGEKPTEKQWEMILASTTSTRVSAGAGSGKSTTLILRLLILHKLLSIPLDEMHVFSFTNASVLDFRKKLTNKLLRWEEVIEHKTLSDQQRAGIEKLVERTVTTFHSVLYHLKSAVLPGISASSEIFDMLKDDRPSPKKLPVLSEDDLKSENPFLSTTLSAKQDEVLTAAHSRAYSTSPRYQELMTTLRREQDRLYWLRIAESPTSEDQTKIWFWNRLLQQEQTYHGYTNGWYDPQSGYPDTQEFLHVDPYRATVANWLIAMGIDFLPLAPFPLSCPIPGINRGECYASFKISDHLFLHIERYSRSRTSKPSDDQKLAYHERDRRRFIAAYSNNTDQHKVLKLADFETKGASPRLKPDADLRLRQWINLSTNALPLTSAPAMLIRLPGDIGESDIKELLYQEGVFIENMGEEVEHLQLPTPTGLDPLSAAIAEALPIFWSAFREELQAQHFIRFHDILTQLRDEQTLHDMLNKIKHLRHLFIDEFQDISPEIVDWFAKTLRVHAEAGAEVSVIAIGDDYQSIYGWRGSHPTFLMRFEQYFPSPSTSTILLTDNFRSRQPIITAAEAVLVPVQQKIPKQGKSVFQGKEQGYPDPVRLEEAHLSWKPSLAEPDIWSAFCTYVSTLLGDLERTGYLTELIGMRKDLTVYLLARTNATRRSIPPLGELQKHLREALLQQGITRFQKINISARTFHQSKGLEADVVLLLDDPQVPNEHPLRELVFSQTRVLGKEAGTYKQTMTDETYRLAYVALTRARLAVMWVPLTERKTEDDAQPAVGSITQATATVSAQGCFVLVKSFLQATGRM